MDKETVKYVTDRVLVASLFGMAVLLYLKGHENAGEYLGGIAFVVAMWLLW